MPHGAVDMDEISPLQSSPEPVPGTLRDGTPTDDELEELGNEIVEWEKLGRRLEVSEPKLAEISQAHEQLSAKVYHMLKYWKQGKGCSATYKTLCNALKHKLVQRQDLAERFCHINETFAIQQPAGAIPAGRVSGEVSGATASTRENGDSTGARSTLKRKHSDSDPERENLKETHKQLRSQLKNVSEKLDSLRESSQDEGKTTSDLEQMETEEQAISEKLNSQIARGEEGMHFTFTEILLHPT